MKKFDYDSLNEHASGCPEKFLVIKTAKEQQHKGVVPENEIMEDALSFMSESADYYFSEIIQRLNGQVSDGINALSFHKAWPNLGRIAKHALDEEIKAIELDTKNNHLQEKTAAIIRLRRKILGTPAVNFDKIFKEDWLNSNFPELTKMIEELPK